MIHHVYPRIIDVFSRKYGDWAHVSAFPLHCPGVPQCWKGDLPRKFPRLLTSPPPSCSCPSAKGWFHGWIPYDSMDGCVKFEAPDLDARNMESWMGQILTSGEISAKKWHSYRKERLWKGKVPSNKFWSWARKIWGSIYSAEAATEPGISSLENHM